MQKFTQRACLAGWLSLFLLLAAPAWAQYTSATQDGNIDQGNEYNNNEYVTANGSGSGGAWYISWNGTTLYLAKNGGSEFEPAFIYLDTDPVQPVTDVSGANGGNARGNLAGTTDFGVTPQLPFRADARIYFQTNGSNTYVEVRYRDGSGNWGAANTTDIQIARNGNVREIAVSWNAVTGNAGRPASFNWLAYQTNLGTGTGNYRYDQAPGNVSSFADNNTTPSYERYFTAVSTNNGYYPTSTNDRPTSVISFTARRDVGYGSFNDINAWDFTMDSPGRTLSRSNSNSNADWSIGGTLVVSNGTLNFGGSGGSGATNAGNLLVTGNGSGSFGTLNMNGTIKPLNVTSATAATGNNVTLSGGGNFTMSGSFGGDLTLNGNFTLSGSTTVFAPNNRAVAFTGSAAQTITGPTTGTPLTFDFMTVNTGAGVPVRLASNIQVNRTLSFTQGILNTLVLNPAAPYTVSLQSSGSLSGETDTSNLTGFVTSTQTVGAGGSGEVSFGNTGLTLTPQGTSAALGSTTSTRSRGVGMLMGTNNSRSINRNFRIVPTNTAGPFDVNLRFNYLDVEYGSATEGDLQLFYSNNATTYPTSGGGTFYQRNISTRDQAANYVIRNDETEFTPGVVYTLGDQTNPLPVTLVSFAGRRVGSTSAVRLNWLTGLEVNNGGFYVERQAATGEWQTVVFVPGTGSSQGHAYELVDAKVPASQQYYRLRQVDFNGTATYSRVVVVAAAGSSEVALTLSPVPAPANQAALTVDLSAMPATPRTLTVYDLQGRLVVQTTAPADAATAELPVAALAAGTYVVQVRTSTDSYRTRFVKL